MQLDNQLFFNHAQELKKQLSLLEEFEMPPPKKWIINWEQIVELQKTEKKNKWNDIPVYEHLLKNNKNPAIYYFLVDRKDSSHFYELFSKSKIESSKIGIEKGVGSKEFKSISHVPKSFTESGCMYVGSRKTKINERFKQHLGYGSGRTGALHMASVFASEKSIPEITFYCHILEEKYIKLTEHIERVVQNKLEPFIGKNILGD